LNLADPSNLEWLKCFGAAHDRLGAISFREGDSKDAHYHFLLALECDRSTSLAEPENVGWTRDTALALGRLGSLAASERELSRAERFFLEAIECLDSVLRFEERPQWLIDRAVMIQRYGDGYFVVGRRGDAAERYYESSHQLESIMARWPELPEAQHQFARTCVRLFVTARLESGVLPHPFDSTGALERALEILEALTTWNPEQFDFSVDYRLARRLQQGNIAAVLSNYDRWPLVTNPRG
jgi:tetratricopeptide (TPR) repeat protein